MTRCKIRVRTGNGLGEQVGTLEIPAYHVVGDFFAHNTVKMKRKDHLLRSWAVSVGHAGLAAVTNIRTLPEAKFVAECLAQLPATWTYKGAVNAGREMCRAMSYIQDCFDGVRRKNLVTRQPPDFDQARWDEHVALVTKERVECA